MTCQYCSICASCGAENEKELKEYESGHKGACPTCEPVGELNIELEAKIKALEEKLKE